MHLQWYQVFPSFPRQGHTICAKEAITSLDYVYAEGHCSSGFAAEA